MVNDEALSNLGSSNQHFFPKMIIKHTKFILCSFLLFSCVQLYGQKTGYGSSTTEHTIISNEGNQYKLKVTFPAEYNLSESYKTLYYLDAWWLSELVLGSYAILNLTNSVEDVVLVGISLEGSELDWNTQRNRDFTPSAYDINKMGFQLKGGSGENGVDLTPETTGKANAFSEFLNNKVFKFVENKYSNITESRGLIGHSFGGLFGIYSMQNHLEMFNDLILISPSAWWNKSELLDETRFSSFNNLNRDTKIHLSYGGAESRLITASNQSLNLILNGLKNENFNFKFEAYENKNHHSVLSRAIYDGLFFLYGKD